MRQSFRGFGHVVLTLFYQIQVCDDWMWGTICEIYGAQCPTQLRNRTPQTNAMIEKCGARFAKSMGYSAPHNCEIVPHKKIVDLGKGFREG